MAKNNADIVFKNARVVTPSGVIEGGVAVVDGKIGAVADVSESKDNLASRFPASLRWLGGHGAERQRFLNGKNRAHF